MLRWKILCMLGLVVTLASCGQNVKETIPETTTIAETESQEISTEDTTSEIIQPETTAKESSSPKETVENKESTKSASENEPDDNFTVDPSDAEAFAIEIKKAVSEMDLEALADLAAFPIYIGFTEGGQSIYSKEDFIALGEEKIFTEALMDSIAQADETTLPPSRAGFVLTKENGTENIIFGLRDGKLSINGINY